MYKTTNEPVIIYPGSAEHLAISRPINITDKTNNWLEDAVYFEIFDTKSQAIMRLVSDILAEIEAITPITSRNRYQETLKMVILREGKKDDENEVRFTCTPFVRKIRDDLERFNRFLEQHDITLHLDKQTRVKTEFLVKRTPVC